jgi:hypothetical protein
LECCRPLLSLQQELHASEAALNLTDAGDDAHRVQDVGSGLLGIVALRNCKHEPVALEGRLDGAKR